MRCAFHLVPLIGYFSTCSISEKLSTSSAWRSVHFQVITSHFSSHDLDYESHVLRLVERCPSSKATVKINSCV